MKIISKIICVLFFMIYNNTNLLGVDPGALKGTYTILKSSLGEKYTDASPVHGAIWAETNLLKNYYRYGNQEEAPIKLIKALFHEVGGSFNVTMLGRNPGAHFSPVTVGKIMGHLFVEYKEPKLLSDNIVAAITSDDDFTASLKKTAEKAVQIDTDIKLVKDGLKALESTQQRQKEMTNLLSKLGKERPTDIQLFFQGKLKEIMNKIEDELDAQKKVNLVKQKEVFEKILNNPTLFEKYNEYRQEKEALEKKQPELQNERLKNDSVAAERGVQEWVKILLDAREASKTVGYFPSMPEGVLLGFLYKKAQSKQDFKKYLDAFFATVRRGELVSGFSGAVGAPGESKEAGFVSVLDEAWVADVYTKDDLEKIPAIKKWADIDNNVANKNYEAIVYKEIMERFYLGSLPRFSEYANVKYNDMVFANCMETTLRNLCNVYAYNPDDRIFKSRDGMTEKIKIFYDTVQKNPVNIESTTAHQDWSDCIQNMPGVAYNRLLISGTRAVAPRDTRGFIHGIIGTADETKEIKESCSIGMTDGKIVTLPKVTIAGGTYLLINGAEQKGFEVQPSLRNTIIIMNNFFGLGLFAGKDFVTEFARKNFNMTYFPVLCEKLEWGCTLAGKDLDKKDYTNDWLSVDMQIGDSAIALQVMSDHGELTKSEDFVDTEKKDSFADVMSVTPSTDSNHFKALFMRDALIELIDLTTIPIPLLFTLTTGTIDVVKGKILEKRVVRLYDFAAQYIISLPMMDDLYYHSEMFRLTDGAIWTIPVFSNVLGIILERLELHTNELAKGNALLWLLVSTKGEKALDMGIKTKVLDMGIKTAVKLMNTGDEEAYPTGLKILEQLVEQDMAFDIATKAVLNLIKSKNKQVLVDVVILLIELVKKEQAVDIATNAILDLATGMISNGYQNSSVILSLLTNLLTKNRAIQEAHEVVSMLAADNTSSRMKTMLKATIERLKKLVALKQKELEAKDAEAKPEETTEDVEEVEAV